jgi:hypothetical protein
MTVSVSFGSELQPRLGSALPHNTKSGVKRQIGTRRKQCIRFTKQSLQNCLKIRKQKRDKKTQTRALYDVIWNLDLTPEQSRELSSAVNKAITSYLKTGHLNITEPPPKSDVSVETPRHSISHIEHHSALSKKKKMVQENMRCRITEW